MCPTFVSKKGIWYAAKEKVGGLTYKGKNPITKDKLPIGVFITGDVLNPNDPFMYDGADREALKMLHEQGYDLDGERVIGLNFEHDPQFIQAVRNMGFNTVKEYLKVMGYDDEKDTQDFLSRAEHTKAHDVAQRVKAINVLGGGRDIANPGSETELIGGFGEERLRSAKEVKKLERV